MGKARRRFAERFVNQNLLMRVRQMILSANYVRNSHLDVVADNRQIIKRMTVRAQQNEVFDLGVIAFLKSVNAVFKNCFSGFGNFQANRKRLAAFGSRIGFFFR